MKRSAPGSIQSSGLQMELWRVFFFEGSPSPTDYLYFQADIGSAGRKVKITHDRIANVTRVIVKQKMEIEHPT